MTESLKADFRQHPFVLNLDPQHVQTLLECAQECRFTRGEYLKRQGEPADQIYLIESGEVTLEISVPHHGLLRIETLGSGQVLGWSCLVEPYRWRFDARAVTPVEGFALDTVCLRAKCERDQSFGYNVLSRCVPVMAQRLEATQLKLMELQDRTP